MWGSCSSARRSPRLRDGGVPARRDARFAARGFRGGGGARALEVPAGLAHLVARIGSGGEALLEPRDRGARVALEVEREHAEALVDVAEHGLERLDLRAARRALLGRRVARLGTAHELRE